MRHSNIARYMPSVQEYRERLAGLQGAWDTLSLLSHLGADSSDMSGTRQAFESLAGDLVSSLTRESHRKSLLALKAKAQIAIDILVRNLFERTADVGFLATDQDLVDYVARSSAEPDHEAIRRRLQAYVAKYSVYRDIALVANDGTVLLQLDGGRAATHTRDALIAETLSMRAAYVETYRTIDFLDPARPALVYSHRIGEGAHANGVLCLRFDLEDEIDRVFAKLTHKDDWAVFAYVTPAGDVIGTSDRLQLPLGARVPLALEEGGAVIRFAGREYLAITRRSPGYQGYSGPGWYSHAMVPLEHAFEDSANSTDLSAQMLQDLASSEALFTQELRRIPQQAHRIQQELNRSVWNGNVRLAARSDSSSGFAKALLREIGNAGKRTQETFDHSITDLQHTVISASLESAELLAALAVDILDRNLYERANDCRWWALNATLIQHLQDQSRGMQRPSEILRHINSLYTVYHGLVLFDAERRIVAVSNSVHEPWIGQRCNDDWVKETLTLRDSQAHAVSDYAPSALYGDRHALIYGAALRTPEGRTVGGIGIVFDAESQCRAMLHDALPRSESGEAIAGCIGLFIDRDQRVLSATSSFEPGDRMNLPESFIRNPSSATQLIEHNGTYYAAAICSTTGYREYVGIGASAVVLIPLGTRAQVARPAMRLVAGQTRRKQTNDQWIEIATFSCNGQWLGLLREEVIEAVDGQSLRAVPGKPRLHAGLLMYQGEPITVVDLAMVTGQRSQTAGHEVIIIRAGDTRLGLLVDELASIPEVPATSMLPLSATATRGGIAVIDRAVRPESPDDPVLLLVNVEQLLTHVRSVQANARTMSA